MKDTDCKAQAILELAIFGSLLLMLLGILINYGLRYNFQQQAMQETFRKALHSAAEADQADKPTSVTHITLKDKHIPNPSHPWAVGSITPITSSASVTRGYNMHLSADEENELPVIKMNIQGKELESFTTAGFREEHDVDAEDIEKYKEIYGETIEAWSESEKKWVNPDDNWDAVQKTCVEYGDPDPITGEPVCSDYAINKIRLIDPCAGQIVDYYTAIRQCRQVIDERVFEEECLEGQDPESKKNCHELAELTVRTPWYCEDAEIINEITRAYRFPKIEEIFMFARSKDKKMGLQTDFAQETIENNQLTKNESGEGITTRDTFNWEADTTRQLYFFKQDPSGIGGTTRIKNIQIEVGKNETKNWETGWK